MPSRLFHYPDISIARITDSDVEETVLLINKAYAYQDAYKQAPRTNPAHLRKSAVDNEFYLAKQGNKIVGCIYVKCEKDSAHFGLLTVADEFRGRGLGRAMMKAAESYAKRCGVGRIELDYMSAAPWLMRYYKKYGYAETGTVISWGTIDLIRMSKSLP